MDKLYSYISGEYLFLILRGLLPVEICNIITSQYSFSKDFIQCISYENKCYVCAIKSSNKITFGTLDKIVIAKYCQQCKIFINKLCYLNTFEECMNTIKCYADKCDKALNKAYSSEDVDMNINYYQECKNYYKYAITYGDNIISSFNNNEEVTKIICDTFFVIFLTLFEYFNALSI